MSKDKILTTNDIQPLAPPASGPRKPAAGPMITTSNVGEMMGAARQARVAPGKKDVKLVPAPDTSKRSGGSKTD